MTYIKTVPKTFPNINLMPTTANKIKNIINSLTTKGLCGFNKIKTKLLRNCMGYVSALNCYVCNQSMLVRAFPETHTKKKK
jgi:hypothetical protein